MSNRGVFAEDATAEFRARHGLKLLERDYRCRCGEIDLVLRETGL